MKKGNTTEYWLFMEKEYGRAVIDELLELDKKTCQRKAYEYDEMTVFFKQKLNDMIKIYGEQHKGETQIIYTQEG